MTTSLNFPSLIYRHTGLREGIDGAAYDEAMRLCNAVFDELLGMQLSQAARDVLAERHRQISIEGWTPEHDDAHGDGGLASAAACYALHTEPIGNVGDYLRFWPWAAEWWKPRDRRRNIVKSGALILAELERIDRARANQEGDTP